MATFSRHDKVVLTMRVPLCTFNVFVSSLCQRGFDVGIAAPDIHHIDDAIVATSQQDLLIDVVPADDLDFVRVGVPIGRLTRDLIQVPDPHCMISRTRCQIFFLERVC